MFLLIFDLYSLGTKKKKKTDITKRVNADNPQYDNPVGIAQTIIMTIL